MTDAKQRNGKLLIAGGGTGGHVFPALAIAREWISREGESQVVFVGTQRGIEARLVPEAGFALETIRSAGLKGMGGMKLARNTAKLVPAMWDSFSILRRHRFAAALGVGGYAAGPMMLAAILRGLPAIVFEPNAEPGFTNRVLARMATRIATAYESPTKLWGSKATLTGIPVRPEFFAIPPREPAEPFHLLITGAARARWRSIVRWSMPPIYSQRKKIASPSFTKPANATIMPYAWPMRDEKSTRRFSPSSETCRRDLPRQI